MDSYNNPVISRYDQQKTAIKASTMKTLIVYHTLHEVHLAARMPGFS